MPRRPETFPRHHRLRKHRDYQRVQSSGAKLNAGAFIVLTAQRAVGEPARVGFTVSKRVGNAVVRNRVKRLLREAFRRRLALLREGLDVVVIATPRAATLSASQVASEVDKVCKRCGGSR